MGAGTCGASSWGLAETPVTSTQGWETAGSAGAGSAVENPLLQHQRKPQGQGQSLWAADKARSSAGPCVALGRALTLSGPHHPQPPKAQVTALCPLYLYPAKPRALGPGPAWLDWALSSHAPYPTPTPSREEAPLSRSTLTFQEWE